MSTVLSPNFSRRRFNSGTEFWPYEKDQLQSLTVNLIVRFSLDQSPRFLSFSVLVGLSGRNALVQVS